MTKPVYPNEPVLFAIALVVSIIGWVLLTLGTIGTIFIILPVMYLFYLFIQSGLISYLKGNGVLVSADQFPDIKARVESCADKIDLAVVPKVYIIHGNGVFNAFATKFLRTHYIILLSDIVDALEGDPEAINFYIGHEMGHIDRRHMLWQALLAPALVLPLLGAAYSRAREYTADAYGAACCSPDAAQKGLLALAAGGTRYKTVDVKSYLAQVKETSGFWMSFHELVANYPWLTKRFLRVSSAFPQTKPPLRNIFAYLPALLVPRLSVASFVLGYLVFIIFTTGSVLIKHKDLFEKLKHHAEQSAPLVPGAQTWQTTNAASSSSDVAAQAPANTGSAVAVAAPAKDNPPAAVQTQDATPAVPHNMAEAVQQQLAALIQKAQGGDPAAQISLGALSAVGKFVPQDSKVALMWWQRAANQGYPKAQMILCNAYARGQVAPQDWAESYFWCSLAVNNGQGNAASWQQVAQKNLTPDQTQAANQRVQAWKPAQGQ